VRLLYQGRFEEVFVAEKMTSIQVSVETKDRLTKLGIMGDTYDTIVRRLLDKVGKKGVRKSE
jgi:hypothetical protein